MVQEEWEREWTRLHNEKLHNLFHSPNIVREIKAKRLRWAGHLGRMGEGRNVFKILTGEPTGRNPLWRTKSKFNIRIDLKETYQYEELG